MSKYISGIRNSNISIPPSGNITTTNTVSSFSNGSAGNPSITFTSDLNTGIYRINEDIIGVSTNGVERMRITNVGTQVSSLNITGLMTTYGGAFIASADNIPAQTNFGLYIAGNPSSSISGRIYVGDGTGWSMHLSKRISSTNTDLFTFSDSGALTITSNIEASSTSTGSLILNGIGMGQGKIYTTRDILNTGGYYYGKAVDAKFTTQSLGAYVQLDDDGNKVTLYNNVTIGNSQSGSTRLLDVQGNIRMSSLSGGGTGFFQQGGLPLNGLEWYMQTSGISGTAPFNPRVSYSIKQVAYNGTGNVRLDFNSCGSNNTTDANILTMTLKHGNVGIGTNDPNYILSVKKSNNITSLYSTGEGETTSLLLGTPHTGDDAGAMKVGLIAEGITSWSRAKLHFCLENTANNGSAYNATIADAKMTITPDGNVGIGTSSPNYKCQIAGSGLNMLTLGDGDNNSGNTQIAMGVSSSTSGYGSIQAITTTGSTFGNLILNGSGGNIGIGSTNANSRLHVVGATNTGVMKICNNTSNGGDQWWLGFCHGSTGTDANDRARIGCNILAGGSGRLFFTTGNQNTQSERMRIDESGNVGIGTSSPNAALQLGNILSNRRIVLYEDFNNNHQFAGFGVNSSIFRYQIASTANSHVFYAATSSTTSNELFRISGGGSITVTNSTSGVNLEMVQLTNSNPLDSNFRLIATKGATTNTNGDIMSRIGLQYSNTDANAFIRFHRGVSQTGGFISFSTNNDTERMRIDASGNVQIQSTAVLELGVGITKETSAGKIGYQSFSGNGLDIVGAGTSAGSRKVILFDDVDVIDTLNAPYMNSYTYNTSTTFGPPTSATFLVDWSSFTNNRIPLTGILSVNAYTSDNLSTRSCVTIFTAFNNAFQTFTNISTNQISISFSNSNRFTVSNTSGLVMFFRFNVIAFVTS